MYRTACVVSVRLHGKNNSQNHDGSCCGILLDSDCGLVLAHGTCLGPFLEHLDLCRPQLGVGKGLQLQFEVLLEDTDPYRDSDNNSEKKKVGQTMVSSFTEETQLARSAPFDQMECHNIKNLDSKRKFYAFSRFPAEIIDFFQCRIVEESLESLMPEPSWELLDRKDTKDVGNKDTSNNTGSTNTGSTNTPEVEEMAQKLMSSFIVLKLKTWESYQSSVVLRPTSQCVLGEKVEICSTPFGDLKVDAFMNSLTQGIVSNLAGKNDCLILSDARCILGGEGAPLYTFGSDSNSKRYLTGIVIASLCWKNEEWVGLCVACDIGAVLESGPPYLQRLSQAWQKSLSFRLKQGAAEQDLSWPEVVLLKVGSTWGSGVVVNQERGLILTCSHVIKEAHLYPVLVKRKDQVLQKTIVMYRQHLLQHQFDLAVLQCVVATDNCDHKGPSRDTTTTPQIASPVEGTKVFMVGHALFGVEHNLQPSVTSGTISKVIRMNNVPVMIQTTCAVHPGASGGALVDSRGKLLGIAVCNARDNTTGASFPHINMSIPACTVWQLISDFINTRDVCHLEKLKVKNKLLDTIWALETAQDSDTSCVHSKL